MPGVCRLSVDDLVAECQALYGLGILDLLRLLLLWALHILVGWTALIAAVLALPKAGETAVPKTNPFSDAPAKEAKPSKPSRPSNPFTPPE